MFCLEQCTGTRLSGLNADLGSSASLLYEFDPNLFLSLGLDAFTCVSGTIISCRPFSGGDKAQRAKATST